MASVHRGRSLKLAMPPHNAEGDSGPKSWSHSRRPLTLPSLGSNKSTTSRSDMAGDLASGARYGMDDEKYSKYAEAFGLIDADEDGRLDPIELMQCLKNMGLHSIDEDTFLQVFQRVDTNGNGTVEFDEFLEIMKQLDTSTLPSLGSGYGAGRAETQRTHRSTARELSAQASSSSMMSNLSYSSGAARAMRRQNTSANLKDHIQLRKEMRRVYAGIARLHQKSLAVGLMRIPEDPRLRTKMGRAKVMKEKEARAMKVLHEKSEKRKKLAAIRKEKLKEEAMKNAALQNFSSLFAKPGSQKPKKPTLTSVANAFGGGKKGKGFF